MSHPVFGIYGSSGFGREVMPIAREQLAANRIEYFNLVFVDDNASGSTINGHKVISYREFLNLPSTARYISIAIANSRVRAKLALQTAKDGILPWTLKSKNTVELDSVELGEGSIVAPFCMLTSNLRIGGHFHANIYSYVAHDCLIGDFVTFAPAVKCNGNVIIEDHAYIGTGAIIKQGTRERPLVIGEGAVVGMGAVVTRSVEPGVTVVGNPAKIFQKC